MPQLAGLLLQGLDHGGMSVAQRVHGDAGDEIEISRAVLGEEADALPLLENLLWRPVDRHDVLARIAHDNSLRAQNPVWSTLGRADGRSQLTGWCTPATS